MKTLFKLKLSTFSDYDMFLLSNMFGIELHKQFLIHTVCTFVKNISCVSERVDFPEVHFGGLLLPALNTSLIVFVLKKEGVLNNLELYRETQHR